MFYIKIPTGYVAGFNEEHLIVQTNPDPKFAMHFFTLREARGWVDRYVDAGYGLNRDSVTYEELDIPWEYGE